MSDKALLKLGKDVVDRLGQGPSAQDLMEQRRRFLSDAQRTRATFRLPALVIAGTAVAAGVLAIVFSLVRLEGISFRVGEDQNPGVEGQWVEADEASSVPIHFEGGSEFVLDAKSAARVVRVGSNKVIVDLSKGTVRCRVHGNGKTGWLVRAGSYRVEVTGTKFDVAWDPDSVELDVTVTHGSVLVSGAALNEYGVKLVAGDRLSVDKDRTMLYQNASSAGQQVQQVELETEEHEPVDPMRSENAESQPLEEVGQSPRVRETTSKPPQWKQLYGKKEYAEVIEHITAQGLEPFIRSASEQELWQVGNAARYARRGDIAHRVLQALISRFPNRPKSLEGTFLLGRVEMELQGDPSAAQKRFEQYLSQAPSGPLAEEALGRLIDVCRLTGKDAAAQKYARRYLSSYPKGPFAPLAQSVLSTGP